MDCADPFTSNSRAFLQRVHQSSFRDIEACYHLILAIKEDAEMHIKFGRFKQAEECYNYAIKSLHDVKGINKIDMLSLHDEAILWSNRSLARCKQKKYSDAFDDALQCVRLDASYSKGYWRASQALKGLGKYAEASSHLLKMLSLFQPSDEDFICFMSELAILITYITSAKEWSVCEQFNIFTTESLPIWRRIIKNLSDHDEYEAIGILTMGSICKPEIPETVIHKMADIPGLTYKFVNVGKMLKFLTEKEGTKTWHLKLAEFMLKREANIQTIAEAFSKPLLVVMTQLSMEAELPSFLSLAWDKVTPAQYDDADLEGSSAMHMYAKSLKRSKANGKVILKDLLGHGCLTTLKDKNGKLPVDYIPDSEIVRNVLLNADTKSGNGATLNRLQKLQDEGNDAVKKNELDKAVAVYNRALTIAVEFKVQSKLPVLYSNLSAVYIKLGDYEKALNAANMSLQHDATFTKSYFRKGQALFQLKEYAAACESYICGFNMAQDISFKQKFTEEASFILGLIPEMKRYQILPRMRHMLASGWFRLLELLSINKHWEAINILFLGPPYYETVGAPGIKLGIMGFESARSVVLSTVFEILKESPNWNVPLLVKKLLTQGASPESLGNAEETYFHAAVRFSIQTLDTQVLEWILQKDDEKKVVFALDSQARTPLHTLCIEQKGRKDMSSIPVVVAKLLLEKGVSLKALDLQKNMAVVYALEGSQLHNYLKELLNGKPKKSEGSRPSVTKSWTQLKEEGNKAFKAQDYNTAIQVYSQALDNLKIEINKKQEALGFLSDEDGHSLAVLYGNRAECHHKLNNIANFLEDAKKNVDYDGNWYKGHQRVGKAFREKGKLPNAIKAFVNAYNTLKPENGEQVKRAILTDLIETAVQQKGGSDSFLQELMFVSIKTWVYLTYDLIKKKDWHLAEFVVKRAIETGVVTEPLSLTDINLEHFCNRGLLQQHYKWICRLLINLLKNGADIENLKFHPGDTFFHAVISIVSLTPSPPLPGKMKAVEDSHNLLYFVIETFIIPKHLQNLTDDKGNTVLHHLATLKGTDQMRDYLGSCLISTGVDVLALNKDRKLAIDLTSPTDILRVTLQRKMKEINHIREQSKQRERKAKEEIKVEQKKESAEVKRKVKENKKPAENNTTKPTNTEDGKKSKPVKQKSKGPCDQCEIKLEEALAYQKEENYEKAYLSLVEVINSPHNTDVRHKKLRETSLERVAALLSCDVTKDIPMTLVYRISIEGTKDLLNQLAQRKNWRLLEMFVTKTRMAGNAKALANFARSMSLFDAIVEPSADGLESTKIGLINLLQTNGAKFDRSTSAKALEACMKNSEWKVVLKLLAMGANPKGVTLTTNDTPNHAALQVALVKDPGNFSILEELRNIYEKDNAAHPYLSVSCIDEDGNTLLHLAAMAKFSQHSLRAVEMLCERHAPAGISNKEGKLPMHYLPSLTDRRSQYLKNAMARQGISAKTLPDKTAGSKDSTKSDLKKDGPMTAKKNIEASRNMAEEILKEMPDVSFDFLLEKGDNKENQAQSQHDSEEEEDNDSEDSSAETSEQESYDFDVETSNDIKEDQAEDGNLEIDVTSFDNLEWDIECTEEVWSLLRNRKERSAPKDGNSGEDEKKSKKKRIPDFLKVIIVRKIHQLASGNWSPQLQSPIKGVPDTLLLYRIALPQGASLIWELAVAFSPRRSETAERLLASESGAGEDVLAVKGGRIYSELIRIWTVVLKGSDLRRAVRKIVSAHQKGKSCIIQKKLQGLSSSQLSGKGSAARFPVLYVERNSDYTVHMWDQNKIEKLLFPPASTHKNEFHILKFYSFSSSLVSAVLNNSDTKIDFPFRVTDFEHAIINVDSSSPLLLLGRSGTGKTTCCLYRLWSVFLCYWEQAVKHGCPLLPRSDLPENLDPDNNPEETSVPKGESNAPAQDTHEFLDDVSDDDNASQTDGDDDHGTWFEHLHQVFVTKNPVLCTEVEKNFLKLRHASAILQEHNSRATKSLPNTLQEVDDLSFPLFLTSRQLLLMLDASADGQPFFPRDEDLALKVDIPGWGTQEDIFNIAPLIHDFLVDSSDEDEEEGSMKMKSSQHNGVRSKLKADPRRECTYEIFAYEIWPKVSKKIQIDCHPSLVWTEIMSFIKGSFEALYTEKGFLDKNQYLELGRKRAPNFSGDRSLVYEVFLRYHSYKQQHFLFDEADLVFKVYTRLRTMTYCPWTFHEIYVDETQDFTQAELALLVSLCYDPNKMFLTGDTAQSIMRGISFRFSDLRALFHYAKDTAKENEKYLAKIEVPKKIHQLRHNYRSHTGILSLASAVLDILTELFPDSFDPLQKDQGMFAGPKPVIIESCSPEDLALLLTGNRRKTSHIEFGAHQAILVVNEQAKSHLPEELTTGIVLTIYESKGLEFDDILIYNFFKDSQTKKEWRVVTSILEKLASRGEQEGQGDDNLVEIDTDVLTQSSRPRPLQFDPNQHKILNSELKHLYTALTRARVNVWIFDEDEEKRAPMFEYFKALKLVKCMASGDTEDITEEIMFTETSSPREWRLAGDNYMKQRLYTIAAKCYRKASLPEKEKLANAYQTALEASRKKTSPREMRDLYLLAGTQFLQCDDLHRAALCFQNSQDYQLAAIAFKKNGQLEEAAVQFRRCQNPVEESHCLEELGMFGRAIRVLVDQKMFDRAIDCLHRYDMHVKKLKEERKPLPAVLIENRPNSSEENLCYSAATHYFERNEKGKCLAAINRVQDKGSQIRFLQEKGFWVEAAEKMVEDGQTEQAATLMLRGGQTERALEYATSGLHKQLKAFIHLVLAHKYETNDNFNLENIKYFATKAQESYLELSDYGGQAKAKLILGKHTMNIKLLMEALKDFGKEKPPNEAGKLECFGAFMKTKQETLKLEECQRAVQNIRQAFSMAQVLRDTRRDKNEQQQLYLSFYGVELDVDKQLATWYPHEYPLCQCLMTSFGLLKGEVSDKVTMDKAEVVLALEKQLFSWIKSWSLKVKESLDELTPQHLLCGNFLAGLPCDLATCKHKHGWYSGSAENDAFDVLNTTVVFDFYLQTGLENLAEDNSLKSDLDSLTNVSVKWKSAKDLLSFILPLCPSKNRTTEEKIKTLIGKLRKSKDSVAQVERYLTYLWQNPGRVGKGKSKNVIKEQCKSCDWIVQASFFSTLLKFEVLDVAQQVQNLERQLMTHVKPWFHKGQKYALFKPSRSKTDNKLMVETIGTRFVESMDYLKNEQDPKEAVFCFTKMISILGTRNKLPLMPAMEHLVFWMEFHFCLTWFFVAQASIGGHSNPSKAPLYVTSTMFANVNLVNTMMGDSTIQELVILYEYHEVKQMFKRQDHLCNFLVGNNKYSAFSLISQFNDLCASSQYVLAERVLLLGVVTLLNIPEGFVSSTYEGPIRVELFKLNVTESMPTSLQLLLNDIKKAATFREVAAATLTFLKTRGHVSVFQCQWVGRATCQINWKEFQVTEYSKQSFSDINLQDLVKTSLEQVQAPSHGDGPELTEAMDEEDLRKMEAKKKALEEEEKQKVSIAKIIRLLKVNVMLKRLKRKSFRNYECEELFQGYTISSQHCGICGTTFEQADVDVDPTSEGLDVSDVPALQTRDVHIKTETHLTAHKDFKTFKHIYNSQIHSALDVIKRFLISHKVEEGSKIYTEIGFEVSKLLNVLSDFNQLFNSVVLQRKWSDQDTVLNAFRNLQEEFTSKKDTIVSHFQKFKKEEGSPEPQDRPDGDQQEVTDNVLDIEPSFRNEHGQQMQEKSRTQGRQQQHHQNRYSRPRGRQTYEDYPPEGNVYYPPHRRTRPENRGTHYRQDYEESPDYRRHDSRGNRRGAQRRFYTDRDRFKDDLPPRFKDKFSHNK